ncbi:MAG TPA: TetR/AcrR family transcriptional regulator [Ktedonobacteraceae bacterium]|nr:TetR/AcrR family transcriptional regulator [Ktedonobacteraceae bacterium]
MSPRTEEQNQKIKDERHEQILQAGIAVFAHKGFAATKITDIAAAANMSHGLIYHYFTSKEAVYVAIIERAMQGAAVFATEALEKPGTAWERLRYLCERQLAGIREHPEYYAVIVQALTSQDIPEEAHAALQRFGSKVYMATLTLVQQGQQAGQVVAGDPVELTYAFYSLIQGIAISTVSQLRVRPQETTDNDHSIKVDTALRILKA